ncbi:WD domain, G-beta repeat protein [Cooperia oncophora]
MDDAEDKRLNLNDTVISVGSGSGGNPPAGVRGRRGEFLDLNDALGLPPDENIDIKDDFIIEDDEESLKAAKWNVKLTLRSHLDAIRAMQFHPVEPVLITAGEDGTAKLWNLDGAKEKSGRCHYSSTRVVTHFLLFLNNRVGCSRNFWGREAI